jgi:hypothetical protein
MSEEFEELTGQGGLNDEDTVDLVEVDDDTAVVPEVEDDILLPVTDDGALSDEDKEEETEDEEFMTYMYGEDALNER